MSYLKIDNCECGNGASPVGLEDGKCRLFISSIFSGRKPVESINFNELTQFLSRPFTIIIIPESVEGNDIAKKLEDENKN